MRIDATIPVALALGLACACGGSSGGPTTTPTPAPTPVPTPTPAAGVARLVDSSLPLGSTVSVAPMFGSGQQAPQLRFSAAIHLDRALQQALVRAWVRTETRRCMGGGLVGVDFVAGVERTVSPAPMSSSEAPCALPYATTLVELEVVDTAGTQVLSQSFPSTYSFVAEH